MRERVLSVFTKTFDLPKGIDTAQLIYNEYKGWDSVAHMTLVAALEGEVDPRQPQPAQHLVVKRHTRKMRDIQLTRPRPERSVHKATFGQHDGRCSAEMARQNGKAIGIVQRQMRKANFIVTNIKV